MMWRDLLVSKKYKYPLLFTNGASDETISQAQQELDIIFPKELLSLLHETDGIRREDSYPVIWSVEQIVRENRSIRERSSYQMNCLPISLLLIGDADEAIVVGYPIIQGHIRP